MMEKVGLDDFSVTVNIKWTCPHCQHKNENTWSGSPYSAIAEDGCDERCSNEDCKEFVTVSFYDE